VLRALTAEPRNKVCLFSGRPKAELQEWFASVVGGAPTACVSNALEAFIGQEGAPLQRAAQGGAAGVVCVRGGWPARIARFV